MKKVIGALILGVMFVFSFAGAGFALTYQDGSDIQFTFNSTLSISLSDTDLIIGNLIPGQDDTSNAVDVVVNTNNLYGYTLTATVGDATKDYRDLRHTNGITNIASIDVNSDLSTLSNQSSSVWGYTVSTNGTTWSNYNGLPKYDDTTNTAELRATDGAAADSTTSFKIGAYAEEGQLAGDYTNVINFKVIANSGQLNIQDITASTCPTTPTTVVDVRDGEEYTIQQLADGRCWLLDNLRLDLTDSNVQANLTSTTTNASDVTLNYLINGGGTALDKYAMYGVTNTVGGEAAYYTPEITTDYKNTTDNRGYATAKFGVYYNYCAATAGSYCYKNGSAPGYPEDPTEDICPAGWRLPTGGTGGEFAVLYHEYEDDYNDSPFINAFRVPVAGYFYSNEYHDWGTSFLSSSIDKDDDDFIFNLMIYYDDEGGEVSYGVSPLSIDNKDNGVSVRCVLK